MHIPLTEFHEYFKQQDNHTYQKDCELNESQLSEIKANLVNLPTHKGSRPVYFVYNESNGKGYVHTNHIIGIFWLRQKVSTLKIEPRLIDGKKVNYYAILDEVLKNPYASRHLEDCYWIYDNQPKIQVDKDFKDLINIFLLHHFLRLVQSITRKGLKKGYVYKTENLHAKIKGKILVKDTVKNNHFKGRQDKTYCNYQEHTTNCLENQIIATTLDYISGYVFQLGHNHLSNLLHQVKSYFREVDRITLAPYIFNEIKHSHFFRDYKKAIELARQIYFNHAPSLNENQQNFTVFPFQINMPELFERYCEVKLREQYKDTKAGYGYNTGDSETETTRWKLRPDFLIPSENIIIDSKYKPWYGDHSSSENFKADFQQLALYGRHRDILEKIYAKTNNIDDKVPKLVFIYPGIEKENGAFKELDGEQTKLDLSIDKMESENKFLKIYKVPLQIPLPES